MGFYINIDAKPPTLRLIGISDVWTYGQTSLFFYYYYYYMNILE